MTKPNPPYQPTACGSASNTRIPEVAADVTHCVLHAGHASSWHQDSDDNVWARAHLHERGALKVHSSDVPNLDSDPPMRRTTMDVRNYGRTTAWVPPQFPDIGGEHERSDSGVDPVSNPDWNGEHPGAC